MKAFLRSRMGVISIIGFIALMGFALHRVMARRTARAAVPGAALAAPPTPASSATPPGPVAPVPAASKPMDPVAENAAYLERYYELDQRIREDRDAAGVPVTRRENAATPSGAGRVSVIDDAPVPPAQGTGRSSLRLLGQGGRTPSHSPTVPAENATAVPVTVAAKTPDPTADEGEAAADRPRSRRFNPYGRVLKCELVFTLDSTTEETPLVGLVMEPVYNNGLLVIPAGTELHGVARPDRLRDRLFSGPEWIFVFPREAGRPNGRQLNVRGVALDRVEPDANGMTWGITDGSYGLAGRVIRSLDRLEIKRFVANFLAAGSVALQERKSDRLGQDTVQNTPQNAALQGVSANLQQIAEDVAKEIEEHGVFIRVPAGHQFYFYPMQVIDPDVADISSDIAIVK
ncbi:TrbI/VirB10 family protein [Opitutus sp. ER46]|uniref:TrbI/VirB10 family protein n=1 Tax=Opitutus sp. ER46 TaxID=2161864 RepID=UPI000D30052F|nr:TrbI/VirB10 family protein [Opitutus sp. ER46]PTX91342.1 hypothetical protein DB354_15710 [Opitutus sp. ER46]